jgi:hypothetical protein
MFGGTVGWDPRGILAIEYLISYTIALINKTMAECSGDVVLLKSTLEIHNKLYCVTLTPAEIYWESVVTARAPGGPYSQPLVSE